MLSLKKKFRRQSKITGLFTSSKKSEGLWHPCLFVSYFYFLFLVQKPPTPPNPPQFSPLDFNAPLTQIPSTQGSPSQYSPHKLNQQVLRLNLK